MCNERLALPIPLAGREISSAACMVIRILEAYLSGKSKGKHYQEPFSLESTPVLSQLHRFLEEHSAPARRQRRAA